MHKTPLKALNSILNRLVRTDIDLARSFFRRRIAARADTVTFGILLKGLCRTNRIADAFDLLKIARSNGFGSNPILHNTLIHALCRTGKVGIGRGRSLMEEMENPSDVTFNILISAYCGEKDAVRGLVMFDKCLRFGFVPDVVAVTKLVAVLCEVGRAEEAVEVVRRVERRDGRVDVLCCNTLIGGFCKVGDVKAGRRVMKEMEMNGRFLPDCKTYNLLISAYCGLGDLGSSMDLFREMESVGIDADVSTFDALIKGFCDAGGVGEGFRLLGVMEEKRRGGVDKIRPYNSIIYGLYKEGRFDEANAFLGRMRFLFPRAVSGSLLVLHLCDVGMVSDARLVFDRMIEQCDVPCVLVFACLVVGLSRVGNLRGAFDIMNIMMSSGHRPLPSMFNALIHGFCRNGEPWSACELLEEMSHRGCSPDARSYNSVICAFCQDGHVSRASRLVVEMIGKGLVPSFFTWNALLSHLIHEFPLVDVDGVAQFENEVECPCGS